MKEELKYRITLTEKQLSIYAEALEFYSRFLSGQVNSLPQAAERLLHENNHSIYDTELETAFRTIQQALFPKLTGLNNSYGIGNSEQVPERQIAYEMYREVYHYRAHETLKKDPSTSFNVYLSETLKYSNEPLPSIKKTTPEAGN